MRPTMDELHFFHACAADLIESPHFKQLDSFLHHGKLSCMEHSINVAYYSYKYCLKAGLNVDYKSMIRGALLHDFFLYNWRDRRNAPTFHGFTHPRQALLNAQRHFELNDKEKDIILRHMWPMTMRPPKYKESFIVSMADKYCAVSEGLENLYTRLMPNTQ